MKLRTLFKSDDSERAVSPVIGIILMVAITVTLAGVIGGFVLNLGNNATGSTAPTTDLNVVPNTNDGTMKISVQGGDPIKTKNVDFTVDGSDVSDTTELGFSGNATDPTSASELTAGNTVIITDSRTNFGGDTGADTVKIIWTAPSCGSSDVLATGEYPAA